jgi:hypothetical protein
MDRRKFVLAGGTAAGTAACALALMGAEASDTSARKPAGTPAPFAVIFDRRFAAAHSYASAAAWRGRRIFGYRGDLTALWLHDIEPQWRRRAGALAGMTTPAALFCLEQLAAQHWLRVIGRTEHRLGADQTLISWVIA